MKNKPTHQFQHTKNGVDVPPLIGCKPLGSQANLGGHPELEFEGMLGFFGWRDMPTSLRDRISADIRAAAAEPNLVTRLASAGQVVHTSTPSEFATAIQEQRARMEALMRLIMGPKQ